MPVEFEKTNKHTGVMRAQVIVPKHTSASEVAEFWQQIDRCLQQGLYEAISDSRDYVVKIGQHDLGEDIYRWRIDEVRRYRAAIVLLLNHRAAQIGEAVLSIGVSPNSGKVACADGMEWRWIIGREPNTGYWERIK